MSCVCVDWLLAASLFTRLYGDARSTNNKRLIKVVWHKNVVENNRINCFVLIRIIVIQIVTKHNGDESSED